MVGFVGPDSKRSSSSCDCTDTNWRIRSKNQANAQGTHTVHEDTPPQAFLSIYRSPLYVCIKLKVYFFFFSLVAQSRLCWAFGRNLLSALTCVQDFGDKASFWFAFAKTWNSLDAFETTGFEVLAVVQLNHYLHVCNSWYFKYAFHIHSIVPYCFAPL